MKTIILLVTALVICLSAQDSISNDKWAPFNILIGEWEGEGIGKWGSSKVLREYTYLMGNTYIIGKNKSVYEKQEKNPRGETHENWDILSYDKGRAKYVLRQFHDEDITNTYNLDSANVANGIYEFETVAIENFGEGWRAKEVYEIINQDKFIEHFFLASPGKEYQEYVKNTFRRVK
jgi:hypothetical protein